MDQLGTINTAYHNVNNILKCWSSIRRQHHCCLQMWVIKRRRDWSLLSSGGCRLVISDETAHVYPSGLSRTPLSFSCFSLDQSGATCSNDSRGCLYCLVFNDLACASAPSSTSLCARGGTSLVQFASSWEVMAARQLPINLWQVSSDSFLGGFCRFQLAMLEGRLRLARVAHVSATSDGVIYIHGSRVRLCAAQVVRGPVAGRGPVVGNLCSVVHIGVCPTIQIWSEVHIPS